MAEGVAAQQPPGRQYQPSEYAESHDRLHGVFRARGIELAARAERRRDGRLIELERGGRDPASDIHAAGPSADPSTRADPSMRADSAGADPSTREINSAS